MAELQLIPARHGVATFVPAGQTIKIVNTSGTQVIDTWAFALPEPDGRKGEKKGQKKGGEKEEKKTEAKKDEKKSNEGKPQAKSTPLKRKKDADLPSQEEAEKATQDAMKQGESVAKDAKNATPQKTTWSSYVPKSYVPSLGFRGSKDEAANGETEQRKNSRTWASYFPSGQSFSSYVPKTATDTVSKFASEHQRDTSKSYLEQLQDFSKTPVGAAGVSGMAAMTGSGYSGSLYAGYQAWNANNAPEAPAMEYLSMSHSRVATLHLRPKPNDTLVSNLREPMLTLVEDTSPGIHDTLIAACDPWRYKGLGVENWEQHRSCAENLVLALKELNERAGLKGAKGVGADVTINSVPAPLNLFMNIPWDDEGDLGFHATKSKAGDYVRLKAERDVVVVLSACPQDIVDVNGKNPTDAHFVVEGDEESAEAVKRVQPSKKQRPPPKKLSSQSTVASTGVGVQKGAVPKTIAPEKKVAATEKTATAPAAAKPTVQKAAAAKKPAPKPMEEKKASSPQTQATGGAETNGAPVARKKPRKLSQKPTPAPSVAQVES